MGIALLAVAILGSFARSEPLSLEHAFVHPPEEAKPWVYWFWSDGNLTRAGITADLEAMQRVGIGGVLIMDVDQNVPKGPVKFMSSAWREMFAFAVAEAGRLGLKVNMNNDAGWTGSGGPWIDAAHSMQKVVWTEMTLSGDRRFDGGVSQPETVAGYYRDIALLAFPTPSAEAKIMQDGGVTVTSSAPQTFVGAAVIDGDRVTGSLLPHSAEAEKPQFVQLEFSTPFEARSVEVTLAPSAGSRVLCELQVSQDGRTFRGIAQIQPGPSPQAFESVRARFFRLVFRGGTAALDQLRINEVRLSSAFRISNFVAKSGLKLVSSPDDIPELEKDASIDQARVIDLTALLHDGHLAWDVPPGNWTLLRLGHTSTGKTNYPASVEGKGLEVDKLSSAAVDLHFDSFIGKLIADTGGTKARDTLTTLHVDSWEVGYQNWTPEFRTAFRRLRGYDPLPWLPAFTGRSVGNAALSERFLWDVRRTISELLNENYATRLAERAHENGRLFSVQGYRYGPFDCLSYAGRADLPIGEFWTTRDPLNLHPSVKTMTSAGHIYGKNIIAAEAFTATDTMGRQQNHPYSLKAIGDAAFCAGVNQFIFHRYSMQPWVDDRKPGMTMGPWGVEYERTATWWEQTKPWHDYLSRCQYLLRQGRSVADLCYLQSEEGFNNPALPSEIKPAVPAGYDFDFCSDEIVRTQMKVENGRLVLPDGMSYQVLVLPSQRLMTPALLRKIRELVQAGATVYGPPPLGSPSLAGYPSCDEEVKRLVAELWVDCDCDGDTKLERALGKGKVIWGVPLEQVLAKLGTGPDFAYRNSKSNDAVQTGTLPTIRSVHRELPDRDLYFVANLGDAPAHLVGSFRLASGAPELWQAETGEREQAAVYDVADGRTRVPLDLEPRGSVFVVIRKGTNVGAGRIVTLRKDGKSLWETDAVPLRSAAEKTPVATVIGSFTMAAWVKPAADTDLPSEDLSGTGAYSLRRNDVLFPPPAHEVYGQRDAAGAGFAVGRNGVCVVEHGDHHFPATLVYSTAIHDWTHVAVVFDQGVPQLYLNGKLVGTGLKTLMTVHGGVGVPHGREVEPFKGEHSLLQQFDRALNANEVMELMRTTPAIAEVSSRPGDAPAKVERPELAPLRLVNDSAAWATQPGRYEMTRADGRVVAARIDAVPAPLVVDSEWSLRFPAGWGAPAAVQFPTLTSWAQHSDPGVRYFSGTATYSKKIDLPVGVLGQQRQIWLDLGDVQVIAEVKLNGHDLGVWWKPPFRLDVTAALREGSNDLEVKVTNLWVNRLIGDEQLPVDREWTKVPARGGFALKAYPGWFQGGERSPVGRVTFATWKHYENNAPLLPSGLLGPVTLRSAVKVEWEMKP
jgi:alpha-L-rhamnosidase/Concanavalin A-like lectin/glucanases superfamily